jgi:histidinol-phosphatase (PHP family)
MEGSCRRAVELGLPAVAFTEHVDLVRWAVSAEKHPEWVDLGLDIGVDGRFNPPPLDVEGYLESIERCRSAFADLRIVTGVELGEPHWFAADVDEILATGAFERVLGSQHSVRVDGGAWIGDALEGAEAAGVSPRDLVRTHLAETLEMIEACDGFSVLAHIDYAARYWPTGAAHFPYPDFEEEFRSVLTALASSGRTLEVNTVIPMDAAIVRWWHDVGGETVSFGSDAHAPEAVAHSFADAAAMVEAQGFRPGATLDDLWRR